MLKPINLMKLTTYTIEIQKLNQYRRPDGQLKSYGGVLFGIIMKDRKIVKKEDHETIKDLMKNINSD